MACVIFEDEHLLVVNKPAGINTHAPAPFASAGIYEWLRDHEPRWARLAIIHRLDKETSGVLTFSKTDLANRSLTEQFAQRRVSKSYILLTDRNPPARKFTIKTALTRAGEKYISRPSHAGATIAETRFGQPEIVKPDILAVSDSHKFTSGRAVLYSLEAEPLTGRT